MNGADSDYGNTSLLWAVEEDAKMVKLLLEHGADPNIAGCNSDMPLYAASLYGKVEIAKLLLANGAQRDAQQNNGCTALGIAADMSREDVVKLLVFVGCNHLLKDTNGKVAYDHALNSFFSLEKVKEMLQNPAEYMQKHPEEFADIRKWMMETYKNKVGMLGENIADVLKRREIGSQRKKNSKRAKSGPEQIQNSTSACKRKECDAGMDSQEVKKSKCESKEEE